jgi:tRNA-dihydrouridine synthase A
MNSFFLKFPSQPRLFTQPRRFLSALSPYPNDLGIIHLPTPNNYVKRVSVAPMVDVTDRYFRSFCRILSKSVQLYTPMIVDQQIIEVDKKRHINGHNLADNLRHLLFHPEEEPLTLQMGGNKAETLIPAIEKCLEAGFQRINLNSGCPAGSAQAGSYGAKLMLEGESFAQQLSLVRARFPSLSLSVKCRIGVNERDSFEFFHDYIKLLSDSADISHFIIHCRKALLNLDSDKNRKIPPINYNYAAALKHLYPQSNIEINGEINTETKLLQALQYSDGVMLGRIIRSNIYFLATLDNLLHKINQTGPIPAPITPIISRAAAVSAYLAYITDNFVVSSQHSAALGCMVAPLRGLYAGCSGGKLYRAKLDENLANGEVRRDFRSAVMQAVEFVENYKDCSNDLALVAAIGSNDARVNSALQVA